MTEPANAIEAEFLRLRAVYDGQGWAKTVGYGHTPAVISVDMNKGFTDPASPMGLDAYGAVAAASRPVLEAARDTGALVVLVGSSYDPEFKEAGAWERKVTHRGLVHGSTWAEFDDRLGHVPHDHVVIKRYASAFFGTDLLSRLVSNGVDTIVLTGAATSGCIRATAVDGVQNGFRVMVVEDAVGDRERLPHLASLFDLGTKYADVVSSADVIHYLRSRTNR